MEESKRALSVSVGSAVMMKMITKYTVPEKKKQTTTITVQGKKTGKTIRLNARLDNDNLVSVSLATFESAKRKLATFR